MALFDHLLLISSGISAWLGYTLLSRLPAKTANLFLGLCALAAFCYMFKSVAYSNGLHLTNSYLLFLPINWSAGIGPFLFLYFKYLLKDRLKFAPVDLAHFIPLFGQIAFHTYFFLMPFPQKLVFFENLYLDKVYKYELIITCFITVGYIIASYFAVGSFVEKYKDAVIKDCKQILEWSKILAFALLLFTVANLLVLSIIHHVSGFILPNLSYYCFYVLLMIFIIWMSNNISLYPSITLGHLTFVPSSIKDKEFETKLEAIVLSRTFDCQRGPHPVEELAACLEVDINYLSNYFKIHYGVNYPGYIRRLRMQKFGNLIIDAKSNCKEVQIKELQEQCGYSNRASFNRDVKEVYHYPPSEYLARV